MGIVYRFIAGNRGQMSTTAAAFWMSYNYLVSAGEQHHTGCGQEGDTSVHHEEKGGVNRRNKPRHFCWALLMNQAYWVLGAITHGIDTLDSCYPTRLSRHGTLLSREGKIHISSLVNANSLGSMAYPSIQNVPARHVNSVIDRICGICSRPRSQCS